MTYRQRILTGWTMRRAFFLLMGLIYLVSSAMDGMWLGIVLSFVFIFQSVLGIGCAGGSCPNGNCEV